MSNVADAIQTNDTEAMIAFLEDKTLPIESVKAIYNHYRDVV